MSSSEPVLVAPREIVDLVTRWARLGGLDPGSAQQLGRRGTAAQIVDATTLDRLLAAGAAAVNSAELPEADQEDWDRAHRDGVLLDRPTFRALEQGAAGFLVAESVLDEIHPD